MFGVAYVTMEGNRIIRLENPVDPELTELTAAALDNKGGIHLAGQGRHGPSESLQYAVRSSDSQWSGETLYMGVGSEVILGPTIATTDNEVFIAFTIMLPGEGLRLGLMRRNSYGVWEGPEILHTLDFSSGWWDSVKFSMDGSVSWLGGGTSLGVQFTGRWTKGLRDFYTDPSKFEYDHESIGLSFMSLNQDSDGHIHKVWLDLSNDGYLDVWYSVLSP